jgi:hypothetical protein
MEEPTREFILFTCSITNYNHTNQMHQKDSDYHGRTSGDRRNTLRKRGGRDILRMLEAIYEGARRSGGRKRTLRKRTCRGGMIRERFDERGEDGGLEGGRKRTCRGGRRSSIDNRMGLM